MSFVLKARNMQISEKTEAYIEKKIDKFNRFLPRIEEIRADLSVEQTRSAQDRVIVEITVRADRRILRAEERSHDLHTAIDIVGFFIIDADVVVLCQRQIGDESPTVAAVTANGDTAIITDDDMPSVLGIYPYGVMVRMSVGVAHQTFKVYAAII